MRPAGESGWRPCARRARLGKFCGPHGIAVQGAVLGLIIAGEPHEAGLTSLEKFAGKERAERMRSGRARRKGAKKAAR